MAKREQHRGREAKKPKKEAPKTVSAAPVSTPVTRIGQSQARTQKR